jgi:hypothetical protein
MQRAIRRNSEGLKEEQLIEDYNMYYYAAQRLHIANDNPLKAADIVFNNDLQVAGLG